MATPYAKSNTGGTLPLPRVHIPSWFAIKSPSEYNDALLDLDLLVTEGNDPIYTGDNISSSTVYTDTKVLDLTTSLYPMTNTSDTTNNNYKNTITIGSIPPRDGSIIAYSNDSGTKLNGTNSAHILYFEHAELKSFNFNISSHNHVIDRINKVYRFLESSNGGTLTTIADLDTTYDTPDASSYKMIINSTNESNAVVASGTTVLTLVEGGY